VERRRLVIKELPVDISEQGQQKPAAFTS